MSYYQCFVRATEIQIPEGVYISEYTPPQGFEVDSPSLVDGVFCYGDSPKEVYRYSAPARYEDMARMAAVLGVGLPDIWGLIRVWGDDVDPAFPGEYRAGFYRGSSDPENLVGSFGDDLPLFEKPTPYVILEELRFTRDVDVSRAVSGLVTSETFFGNVAALPEAAGFVPGWRRLFAELNTDLIYVY
jgi:hypothetical protein